ncbi:MAG: T9SS type A sorting domain-containing protein, partial [Bacteroidia bacterium]|nr:T9SS type A sorting domain-containing protein [Bacteroidia bacterium]
RQYASNDNIVTADTGLAVCIPASISYSGLPNWGNADILNNCASCSVALPIELLSFNGHISNKTAVLEWVTASEINNCYFVVERSTDAMSYTPTQTQNGAIHSTSQNAYVSYDNTIEPDILYYYRRQQVDCDGVYTYSNIISLSYSDSHPDLEFIVNNLYTESIELINEEFIEKIMIYNTLGQLISDSKSSIERVNYSNGIYFIQVFSKSGKIKKYKVIKNNK